MPMPTAYSYYMAMVHTLDCLRERSHPSPLVDMQRYSVKDASGLVYESFTGAGHRSDSIESCARFTGHLSERQAVWGQAKNDLPGPSLIGFGRAEVKNSMNSVDER